MKCSIECISDSSSIESQFYCKVHKAFANPNELECLCKDKEIFDNPFDLKQNNIDSINIIYENIFKSLIPKILLNGKEFNGVLVYENSTLNYKDLGGIMLSRLNNIALEEVKCNYCNHYHSDNGKFAYTPHRTHLCQYCGHLFRVDNRNIGNEFTLIYDIPDIKLENNTTNIDEICTIKYDLLGGRLLTNDINTNKVIVHDKEIRLIDFLNDILKDEY